MGHYFLDIQYLVVLVNWQGVDVKPADILDLTPGQIQKSVFYSCVGWDRESENERYRYSYRYR